MQQQITKSYGEEYLKSAGKKVKTAEFVYGGFFKIWCCTGLRFKGNVLEIEYSLLPHETGKEKLLLEEEKVLSFVEGALMGVPTLFPDDKKEVKGSDALKQFLTELKSGALKSVFGKSFDAVVCVVGSKHEIKELKSLGFKETAGSTFSFNLK